MEFLQDFLHQEVPQSGTSMPAYYRRALFISEGIMAAYFLVSAILLLFTGQRLWATVLGLGGMVFCLHFIDQMSARVNVLAYTVITGLWLTWFVHCFGWGAGSPNLLAPILSLAFFNIYERPLGKLVYGLGLIAFRILLFAYSLWHTSGALTPAVSLTFQILNSVIPTVILSITFILFSSSIQARERALTINNQELHREAGTDPLTGLPNRRALLDQIERFRTETPEEHFGIAIADIDFFKKVNDTYGHNCGDYTLKTLAQHFREKAGERYTVCRWGGEEFCFFMPGMNLDQAGAEMMELHISVRKMPLHFGEVDFGITITIGVEENDFESPIDQILDRADRKLYMGKVGGRDRVVI